MLGVLDVPDMPGVLGVSDVLRDESGTTATGVSSATPLENICEGFFSILSLFIVIYAMWYTYVLYPGGGLPVRMFSILHFRLRQIPLASILCTHLLG